MEIDQAHGSANIGDYLPNNNSVLFGLLRTKSERSKEAEQRAAWLRSQLIGGGLEFNTPFGKRLLTYADHTASGRCLQYIENYIIQEVLPVYGNTHTDDSFVGSKTTRMVHKAAEYIKRCMGGGPNEALIFCGSGSSAAIKRLQEVIGIAVPSIMRERVLNCLRDEERWVVFVGPYEHHSNLLSWRQSLAEVVEIGMDDRGLLDMEALRIELMSPKYANRPLLGSFSAGSNVTGILTDTRALARLLHQHGAFACFDFAASGPYVEIDMRSGDIEGYDAVFLSPHKFVGGPGTPGILLMNKDLYQLRSSPPSSCGGGTVAYVNGFDEKDTLYYDHIEEREDNGTPPIIQKVRAALAFWVKEYIGHDFIDLQERVYAETALRRLLPNKNIVVLGNKQVNRLPIFSFLVYTPMNSSANEAYGPRAGNGAIREAFRWAEGESKKGKPLHGRFVAKLLNDLFGIQARGGCACAGPYGHYLLEVDETLSLHIRSAILKGYSGLKPGWTRISLPYYMSKEEFAFVLASLEFIAMYGHRFLPLYQFDWVTGDWTFRKRVFKYHLMKEELALASRDLLVENGIAAKEDKAGNLEAARASTESFKSISVAQNYESYLESARSIALSLPEHPHPSTVPEDIDPKLILFRI
ncbi:probable cysteine desulfurase [Phoenix dactylifera]|uniref:Probable cysteine desulfurase n=1 Tax=Phoenix dactylifera TaxID=42345 RepID=A0A8B7BW16_PHODC|nr:probable cysteine desulfurase [Phoenix dactylifera]